MTVGVLLALLSSCNDAGGAAQTTTTGATATTGADPTTQAIAELESAIRDGARLLLDTPEIEGLSLEFGEKGVHDATAWMQRRANGDWFTVTVHRSRLSGLSMAASVSIGGEYFCATSGHSYCESVGGAGDEPWESFGPIEQPRDRYLLSLDVGGWAEGRALADLDAFSTEDITVAREEEDNGSMTWQLTAPFGNAPALRQELITRTWHFGADGFLQGYRIQSESGILFNGVSSAVQWEYRRFEASAALSLPELGTPLDIDALPQPDDLVLPKPASE